MSKKLMSHILRGEDGRMHLIGHVEQAKRPVIRRYCLLHGIKVLAVRVEERVPESMAIVVRL